VFTIILRLTNATATMLVTTLQNVGKHYQRRGMLLQAGILLELAHQVRGQIQRSATYVVPFPDEAPLTYTQLLNGLVRELQGRTIASDEHNDWSCVLRATADQLDKTHQGGEK